MAKNIFLCKRILTLKNCVMTTMKVFIRNSIAVFSEASRGEYRDTRPEHKALKDSIFNNPPKSSTISDKQSLRNDSRRVSADVRKALNSHSGK